MNGAITENARVLAVELARQFGRDAELAARLADAQDRLLRANERLWWGLHPDGLARVYEQHPGAADMAFAENRSQVLGAPDPLAVVQQAHWSITKAFIDDQSPAEERRQLAAGLGETIRQFVDELTAAGWSKEQTRNARCRGRSHSHARDEEELRMATTLLLSFGRRG